MRRKDGEVRSDYNSELDELVLDLIFEKKIINTDRIRKILNKKYSRKLGWNTIKRHLDKLLKEKKVEVFYETEEGKKKIKLYRLVDNSRIISIKDK